MKSLYRYLVNQKTEFIDDAIHTTIVSYDEDDEELGHQRITDYIISFENIGKYADTLNKVSIKSPIDGTFKGIYDALLDYIEVSEGDYCIIHVVNRGGSTTSSIGKPISDINKYVNKLKDTDYNENISKVSVQSKTVRISTILKEINI